MDVIRQLNSIANKFGEVPHFECDKEVVGKRPMYRATVTVLENKCTGHLMPSKTEARRSAAGLALPVVELAVKAENPYIYRNFLGEVERAREREVEQKKRTMSRERRERKLDEREKGMEKKEKELEARVVKLEERERQLDIRERELIQKEKRVKETADQQEMSLRKRGRALGKDEEYVKDMKRETELLKRALISQRNHEKSRM